MDYYKSFTYGNAVKISNWHDRVQSLPIDNSNLKSSLVSHYKTFGDPQVIVIPKTTTQEQLESVLIKKSVERDVFMPQINFASYPMNDYRFDRYGPKQIQSDYGKITTYQHVFKAPKPFAKKVDRCDEELDPLINRKGKNDFEFLPSSENKFMDDHFVKPSLGKSKINFFRQLRNISTAFCLINKTD